MTCIDCGHDYAAHEHYTVSEHCALCRCLDFRSSNFPWVMILVVLACVLGFWLPLVLGIVRAIRAW